MTSTSGTELTVVHKISLNYAKRVIALGWDLFQTVMNDVGDSDLHYYTIGNTDNYVVLNTLDACLLAYGFNKKVQDLVDEHKDAFIIQKDPTKYGMTYLQRLKDSIADYSNRYKRDKFMKDAIAAVNKDPDLIRPRVTKIHFKFLYEGRDGKYYEKLPDDILKPAKE